MDAGTLTVPSDACLLARVHHYVLDAFIRIAPNPCLLACRYLLYVSVQCAAVICCRARPDQKARVVKLIRDGVPSSRTLAVGACPRVSPLAAHHSLRRDHATLPSPTACCTVTPLQATAPTTST